MPGHGWFGIGVVVVAEVLLLAGVGVVREWFTPVVWTGYVLATDGWVARLTGRSYLTTARRDLVLVVLASIGAWWLFEWYCHHRPCSASPPRQTRGALYHSKSHHAPIDARTTSTRSRRAVVR